MCPACLTTVALILSGATSTGTLKAIAAGGTTYSEPKDYGFMWQHGFQDLDGHIWKLIYMEPSALKQG
jgi:uncharacterized protein